MSPEGAQVATDAAIAQALQNEIHAASQLDYTIADTQPVDWEEQGLSTPSPAPPAVPTTLRRRKTWHAHRANENMKVLQKVGLFSVFESRQAMEEYEATLEKAEALAGMLGEDLEADLAPVGAVSDLASQGSGESYAAKHIRASKAAKAKNFGPVSKMPPEQIAEALKLVNEATENFKKYQFALAVQASANAPSPTKAPRPSPAAATTTTTTTTSTEAATTSAATTTVTTTEGKAGDPRTRPSAAFLRRFSSAWLWSCMIWVGVGLLEKQRKYDEAINALRLLLGDVSVNTAKRGEWWIRLAFDLGHLKLHDQAVDAIKESLRDPFVRAHHRIRLQHKLRLVWAAIQKKTPPTEKAKTPAPKSARRKRKREEITEEEDGDDAVMVEDGEEEEEMTPKAKKAKLKEEAKILFSQAVDDSVSATLGDDVEWLSLEEGSTRIIQSRPIPRKTARGGFARSIFIGYDEKECCVEELALQFYKLKMNYANGIHNEGHIFQTMFGLTFWDIIFDASIPYVFQTPYQDAPLDFMTTDFYEARAKIVDERLKLLADNIDGEVAVELITAAFNKWKGRVCKGVAWERYTLPALADISRCLGGRGLAAIYRRFAMDYRMSVSGMPDLLLWDIKTKTAKLVEVKGPRDKLSDKQCVWIDTLVAGGVDVEVLYVRETLRDGEVDDSLDLCALADAKDDD